MSQPAASLINRLSRLFKSRWKSWLVNLLLVSTVLAGVQLWQTRHVAPGPVPDFTLRIVGSDGQQESITLSQWRERHPGQVVALHFWADWCPICRAEENSVTNLSRDWPVLTVAMQSGDAFRVSSTLAKRGLPWSAAADPDSQISRSLGLHAVPALLVLDAHGRIRAPAIGYTTEIGMRLRLWWARMSS